jgi:hypothetical protein
MEKKLSTWKKLFYNIIKAKNFLHSISIILILNLDKIISLSMISLPLSLSLFLNPSSNFNKAMMNLFPPMMKYSFLGKLNKKIFI